MIIIIIYDMYTHGNWYSQRKFPILDKTYAEIWGSSNQLFEFTTGFTMGKKQGDPLLFYDVKTASPSFGMLPDQKAFQNTLEEFVHIAKRSLRVYIVSPKKKVIFFQKNKRFLLTI